MKSAPSEASSDLERARALSRTLAQGRGGPGIAVPKPRVPEVGFTRLALRRARPLPNLESGARWPRIVDWARAATGASGVFAIDRKGLLVGASGLDDDEATRIGGRLALAFDQSSQIDQVRSLVIDWAGETVTVIEIRDGDDVAVLLGILGHPTAIPIEAVVHAIGHAISRW